MENGGFVTHTPLLFPSDFEIPEVSTLRLALKLLGHVVCCFFFFTLDL